MAIRERWASHWDLRVETDHFAPLERLAVASRNPDPGVPGVKSVLDVGATDRRHRGAVTQRWPEAEYRSLDVDRTLPHDYHDFRELDRRFDLVMCVEVLEHLPATEVVALLGECVAACRPGGHVYLSVPNCIVPYYQFEFTHQSTFTHQDLGALCRLAGLEVLDMTRSTRGVRRHVRIHRLLAPWHRLMRTDHCGSITCLARRPDEGGAEA